MLGSHKRTHVKDHIGIIMCVLHMVRIVVVSWHRNHSMVEGRSRTVIRMAPTPAVATIILALVLRAGS